jgi:hypothetical protein
MFLEIKGFFIAKISLLDGKGREKKQKLFEIKTDSLANISIALCTSSSNTCKNVKGEASRRMVGNGRMQ